MSSRLVKSVTAVNLLALSTLATRGIKAAEALMTDIYYQWAVRYSTPKIPKVPLSDLVNIDQPVSVVISENSPGTIRPNEMLALAALMRQVQPHYILEIGTFDGSSARNMALNAPNARIWTLDLPEEGWHTALPHSDLMLIQARKVGSAFSGTPEAERIVQLLGDSARFDFSSLGAQFDVAFIDGSHTYEYVKSDTERILPLMAPGGWMVWHDCCDMGVGFGVYPYLWRDFGRRVNLIAGTTLAYYRHA